MLEPILLDAVRRIGKREYVADASTPATVATCRASVRHVLAVSRGYAIDLGLPQALDRVFQRAVDAGHAQSDVAAVFDGMHARP